MLTPQQGQSTWTWSWTSHHHSLNINAHQRNRYLYWYHSNVNARVQVQLSVSVQCMLVLRRRVRGTQLRGVWMWINKKQCTTRTQPCLQYRCGCGEGTKARTVDSIKTKTILHHVSSATPYYRSISVACGQQGRV
jgi:hypothetical protein